MAQRCAQVVRPDHPAVTEPEPLIVAPHGAQVQGKEREKVAEAGKALGLDSTYIPFSYIEQVHQPATAAAHVHGVSEPGNDARQAPIHVCTMANASSCFGVHHRFSWKSSRSSSRW